MRNRVIHFMRQLVIVSILFLIYTGCRAPEPRTLPKPMASELTEGCSEIIQSIANDWIQLSDAEFRVLYEQNQSPLEQQFTGSMLRAFIRTRVPNVALFSSRRFLVGETDQPLLYQLTERHFFRVTQRSYDFMNMTVVEEFTVSVAYCMNGVVSGSRSCLRDFGTALKDSNHFKFGLETKFILSDEKVSHGSGLADSVNAWIGLVLKRGKDSIMAIRISRAYIQYYTADLLPSKISFDHPIVVYLHIPN